MSKFFLSVVDEDKNVVGIKMDAKACAPFKCTLQLVFEVSFAQIEQWHEIFVYIKVIRNWPFRKILTQMYTMNFTMLKMFSAIFRLSWLKFFLMQWLFFRVHSFK